MTKSIERNRNISDEPTVDDGVAVVGDNAVTVVVANANRAFLSITIRDEDAWVREIPAATDPAVRKGEFKIKGQTYRSPIDNIYTGEVSIINDKNGKSPTYYVTER